MKLRLHLIVPIATLAILTGCKDADPRPAPAITAFSPKSGPEASTVTITGTNFSDAEAENEVRFNGVKSTVTASTATSITTTVPVGATSGVITVTVAGQSDLSDGSFTLNPLIGIWRFTGSTATHCANPADDGGSTCSDSCPTLTFTASSGSFVSEFGTFEFTYTLAGHVVKITGPSISFSPSYLYASGQLTLVYPPDVDQCSYTETYVK